MTEDDLGYFAGLIDGNGGVSISAARVGRGVTFGPCLYVALVYGSECLEELKKAFGGTLGCSKDGVGYWNLRTLDVLKQVIPLLIPYLRVKRISSLRFLQALNAWPTCSGERGPVRRWSLQRVLFVFDVAVSLNNGSRRRSLVSREDLARLYVSNDEGQFSAPRLEDFHIVPMSLPYLAGLFDSDGGFELGIEKPESCRSKVFAYFRPAMKIGLSYGTSVLDEVASAFKGKVYGSLERRWYLTDLSQQKALLTLILPFLRVKNQTASLFLQILDWVAYVRTNPSDISVWYKILDSSEKLTLSQKRKRKMSREIKATIFGEEVG